MSNKGHRTARFLGFALTAVCLLIGQSRPSPTSVATPAIQSALSDADIQEAITLGMQYKNPEKLWQAEFRKTNELSVKTFHWTATLAIHTRKAQIAAAAATAAHELRQFSIVDARSLPDKLQVVLSTRDGRSRHPYATTNVHLVIEDGKDIIQPESKTQRTVGLLRDFLGQPTNVSYLSTEFTFPMPNQGPAARFVFVSGDDQQHYFDVDFSRLR